MIIKYTLLISFLLFKAVEAQNIPKNSLTFLFSPDVIPYLPAQMRATLEEDSLLILVTEENTKFDLPAGLLGISSQNIFLNLKKINNNTYQIALSFFESNVVTVNTIHNKIRLLKPNNMTSQAGMIFGPELALTSYPDIMTMNLTNNKISVKGGFWFENLYTLNNIPIYYPYHFNLTNLGVSTINYDLLDEVKFQSTSISPIHGNILSSVLKLSMGAKNHNETNINISIYKINLNTKQSFGKHQFALGFNKTYNREIGEKMDIDFLKNTPDYMNIQGLYSFSSDLYGTFDFIFHHTNDNYDFSNFDKASIDKQSNGQSYFITKRAINTYGEPLNNTSDTYGLNHNLFVKKNLNISTQLWIHNRNEFFRTNRHKTSITSVTDKTSSKQIYHSSYSHEIKRDKAIDIEKIGLKSKINIFLNKNNILLFGFETERNTRSINLNYKQNISHFLTDNTGSNVRKVTLNYESSNFSITSKRSELFYNTAFFMSYQTQFNQFYFDVGFRYQFFSHIDYLNFEPRVDLKYEFKKIFTELYFSYGKYSQNYLLAQTQNNIIYSKPILNEQVVLGFLGHFGTGWNFKLETFTKRYSNQFNSYKINGFPEFIYSPLNNTMSKSAGINALIQKQSNEFSISLAYGFSSAAQYDFTLKKEIPQAFDIRHKLTVTSHYDNNSFLNPTLKFSVKSGLPFNESRLNNLTNIIYTKSVFGMRQDYTYQLDLLLSYQYKKYTFLIDCLNLLAKQQILNQTDLVNPFRSRVNKLEQNYTKDIPLIVLIGANYQF